MTASTASPLISNRQRVESIRYLTSVLDQLVSIDCSPSDIYIYLAYDCMTVNRFGTKIICEVYYRLHIGEKRGYIPMQKALEQLLRLIRAYTLNQKPKFPRQRQ